MTARKTNRGRPVDPKSKLSRARALFNRRTPRQAMLKLFRSKLRISPYCASTYYQIARSDHR